MFVYGKFMNHTSIGKSSVNVLKLSFIVQLVVYFFIAGCSEKPEGQKCRYLEDGLQQNSEWFSRDFTFEQQLLGLIRNSLVSGRQIEQIPSVDLAFDPSVSHVAITLFHEGQRPIRWLSRRDTLLKTLNRNIYKLRGHSRFSNFEAGNLGKCRIMLEVITRERKIDIRKLSPSSLNANRFEPGITGFRLRYNNQTYFYMPTDAAVKSHLTIKHVLNHITERIGIAKKTDKISERIKILLSEDIEWFIVYSVAFVSYENEIIPLYRGYPYPMQFSEVKIASMTQKSVEWVLDNMREDGRFLYYYDGVEDSVIDHTHPTRTLDDNYYNTLRHSGGIITLLRMYEITGQSKYLQAADKALVFLSGTLREHDYNGSKAYYVFYNDKAKLGGSGIALTAFLGYRQFSKDSKYDKYIHGLANHLLSRVADDGEMIGYYIHPSFNNGKPILKPKNKEKKALFSFFYPGEALLGLALYDQQMDLTVQQRQQVRDASRKALDFLVKIRPKKYADLFQPLPSDGWLMQAIEEWAEIKEFQRKEYLDFVFNDARQIISHMYNRGNTLYLDYPGAFFYEYGDHGYIDGARAEGLIAAFYLAQKTGDTELAQYFLDNCKIVAESLMYSYNSEQSTFMHKYPQKSIGTFRFKFTRHWVRIDTTQHAVCFYVRLLLTQKEVSRDYDTINSKIEEDN